MNAVLVRHTRSVVPPGVCYGRTEVPLADTFPEEARAVRERLPWVPPEVWRVRPSAAAGWRRVSVARRCGSSRACRN